MVMKYVMEIHKNVLLMMDIMVHKSVIMYVMDLKDVFLMSIVEMT